MKMNTNINIERNIKNPSYLSFLGGFVEGSGSIVEKSGSPDIYVYTIKGYKQIIKFVLPFLEKYVQPFSCKNTEFNIFKEIVILSSEGKQRNKEDLIYLVKLAYTLEGKGKNRKRDLSDILQIIEDKHSYFKK